MRLLPCFVLASCVTPTAGLLPRCCPDPFALPPQKSLEKIGVALQDQYTQWQPRVRPHPLGTITTAASDDRLPCRPATRF